MIPVTEPPRAGFARTRYPYCKVLRDQRNIAPVRELSPGVLVTAGGPRPPACPLLPTGAGPSGGPRGSCYRELARSRGKNKAYVAVGNNQLKVYHKLPSHPGMRYQDLGPDYYQRRRSQTRPKTAYHVSELEELGLEVTLCRPAPAQDDPEPTQAA